MNLIKAVNSNCWAIEALRKRLDYRVIPLYHFALNSI
uniref:Uncharacterized protein n=1 Tax=Myoviridae sp. ctijX18 TaxID=2825154 RepID=A0A8S5USY2_9CAUD|nr:MAG TPA: hypothetical protein [Myoviridae sp. ctijX18]DAJ69039.1 MAG TPA: hypothetical protein [Caudoviricetes sp.]